MFKEIQKKMYLNECKYENPNTLFYLNIIFDATAKTEDTLGKDVSEFSKNDVIILLKSLDKKTPQTLQSMCSFLKNYSSWCIDKKLTSNSINQFDDVKELISSKVLPFEKLKYRYFTKEYLLEKLELIPDVTNRFILYALFHGITEAELANLKIIDLQGNRLRLSTNRTLFVDELFQTLMIQANEQTQYFSDGVPIYNKFNRYNYAESEYVLKVCDKIGGKPVGYQIIESRLKTMQKQIDNKFLTISNLEKTALMHFLKEEFKKENISLYNAFFEPKGINTYKYSNKMDILIKKFGVGFEPDSRTLRSIMKKYIELLSFNQEEYGYEQYSDDIDRLMNEESLDEIIEGTARKEQKYLRKRLFKGKDTCRCGICGEEFTLDLLVAAHIKKRSECTKDERLDVDNIVAPMCKLGCDNLYENGYIFVIKGIIKINNKKVMSKIVKEYLEKLDTTPCPFWTSNNEKYFKEHNKLFMI